ncbi:MAG: putative sulfate exporter family transporter [Actinomycetaceae bacterium]|nr:putative sulfate exporter family transporter [Actinomycetaceae bacterium]
MKRLFGNLRPLVPNRNQGLGILAALGIALVSLAVNRFIPLLSGLLIAILLGMLLNNVGLIRRRFRPGLAYSAKTILRLGVILLGFRLSIPQVLSLGIGPIITIIVTVVCTYVVALGLGWLMRIGHSTRVLTATGTAICGAAAVAGMSSVLRPQRTVYRNGSFVDDDEVQAASATAIATVTLFGTFAMLLVPVLGTWLGLNASQLGVWIGSAIHEVGQVVAAAGFISPEVSEVATVTKLGRVVLLAPLVAIVGLWEAHKFKTIYEGGAVLGAELDEGSAGSQGVASADATESDGVKPSEKAAVKVPIIPGFVLGFLAMVVLRSVLGSPEYLMSTIDVVDMIATFLLTLAMGAMGTAVNLKAVVTTGRRAMILGFLVCLIAGAVSLAAVLIVM